MNNLIDGKLVADFVKKNIKIEIENSFKTERKPCLAVIVVGEDVSSQIYIKNKQKACEDVGFEIIIFKYLDNVCEKTIINTIHKLNFQENVDGILVQLPLPKHINAQNVFNEISPEKDVDCFNPINIGLLSTNNAKLKPCTPLACISLLKHYNINLEGKICVVIGRSFIVGRPMSIMFLNENATVITCHSKTKNIKNLSLQADIIVCAVGKPNFLTADMIKKDAIIIDVGINRNMEDKICGDVDFLACQKKAGLITPVPAGVGPMTVAMLIKNCFICYKSRLKKFLNN